ncbi:TPA: hypothetical protein JBI12_12810 [Legionella pneumophila]|nr:hypothetical protein [Legionella pneumophila]
MNVHRKNRLLDLFFDYTEEEMLMILIVEFIEYPQDLYKRFARNNTILFLIVFLSYCRNNFNAHHGHAIIAFLAIYRNP